MKKSMNMYGKKHRIWIKIVAVVVVCLFTVNTVSWAFPARTVPIVSDKLQVQSMFSPILDQIERELKAQAGYELYMFIDSVLHDKALSNHDLGSKVDRAYSRSTGKYRALHMISNAQASGDKTVIVVEVWRGPNKGKKFEVTIACASLEELFSDETKLKIEEIPQKSAKKPKPESPDMARKRIDSFISVLANGFVTTFKGKDVHVRGIYPDVRMVRNYLEALRVRTSEGKRVVPEVFRVYVPRTKINDFESMRKRKIIMRDRTEREMPQETLRMLKEAEREGIIEIVEVRTPEDHDQMASDLNIETGRLELFQDANLVFVSDYVGPNVPDFIQENAADTEKLKAMGRRMAVTLKALHQKGIICGDTHHEQFVVRGDAENVVRVDLRNIYSLREVSPENVHVEWSYAISGLPEAAFYAFKEAYPEEEAKRLSNPRKPESPDMVKKRKPAGEERGVSWGKDVPSLEIPFSQGALKYQREHSAEAAAYRGPFVVIYRGVPEFLFARMKEHGFEVVPDEAVLARLRNEALVFQDDYIVHRGRLPLSGNFDSSQGTRNLQHKGAMLSMEIPADLLLDERVLVLDKDAAAYLHELAEEISGEGIYDISEIFKDRDTEGAKRLISKVGEISSQNKAQLRHLLEIAPDKVRSFVASRDEIIIPHDLLNLCLDSCRELPIHRDENYFKVIGGVNEALNPVYISDFWEPILKRYGAFFSGEVPVGEEATLWSDGRFAIVAFNDLHSHGFALRDNQVLMGKVDILRVRKFKDRASKSRETELSDITIDWNMYPTELQYLMALRTVQKSSDNPFRRQIRAIADVVEAEFNIRLEAEIEEAKPKPEWGEEADDPGSTDTHMRGVITIAGFLAGLYLGVPGIGAAAGLLIDIALLIRTWLTAKRLLAESRLSKQTKEEGDETVFDGGMTRATIIESFIERGRLIYELKDPNRYYGNMVSMGQILEAIETDVMAEVFEKGSSDIDLSLVRQTAQKCCDHAGMMRVVDPLAFNLAIMVAEQNLRRVRNLRLWLIGEISLPHEDREMLAIEGAEMDEKIIAEMKGLVPLPEGGPAFGTPIEALKKYLETYIREDAESGAAEDRLVDIRGKIINLARKILAGKGRQAENAAFLRLVWRSNALTARRDGEGEADVLENAKELKELLLSLFTEEVLADFEFSQQLILVLKHVLKIDFRVIETSLRGPPGGAMSGTSTGTVDLQMRGVATMAGLLIGWACGNPAAGFAAGLLADLGLGILKWIYGRTERTKKLREEGILEESWRIWKKGYDVLGIEVAPRIHEDLKELTGKGFLLQLPEVYSPLQDGNLGIAFARAVKDETRRIGSIKRASGQSSMRILDIGAGTGIASKTSYNHALKFVPDVHVDAIDINVRAIRNMNYDLKLSGPLYSQHIHPRMVTQGKEFERLEGLYDLILFQAPNAVKIAEGFKNPNPNIVIDENVFKHILEQARDHLSDKGAILVRMPPKTYKNRPELLPEGMYVEVVDSFPMHDEGPDNVFVRLTKPSFSKPKPESPDMVKKKPAGEPAEKNVLHTDVRLARKGLADLRTLIQSLPRELAEKVSRDKHFVGVYTGVMPEAQIYLDAWGLDQASKEILMDAIEANNNFVMTGKGRTHLINLEAACRVMKNNPEHFPLEALENPRKWFDDWLHSYRGLSDEEVLRYGLLSGYPVNAVRNYPVYHKQVNPKLISHMSLFTEAERRILQEHQLSEGFDPELTERFKEILTKKTRHILTADEIDLITGAHHQRLASSSFLAFEEKDRLWARDLEKVLAIALEEATDIPAVAELLHNIADKPKPESPDIQRPGRSEGAKKKPAGDHNAEEKIDETADGYHRVIQLIGSEIKGSQEPIDFVIDLSLFSKNTEDLERNMETWAYLILLCRNFKNVRFRFELPKIKGATLKPDELKADIANAANESEVLRVLKEKLREKKVYCKGDIDVDEFFRQRINNPESRENVIEIPVWSKAWLVWMRENMQPLEVNQYPVAMDEFTSVKDREVALRNFQAAVTIGLSKAALVIAKRSGNKQRFEDLKDNLAPRLDKLFEAVFGKPKGITPYTLDSMVYSDGNHKGLITRINQAIELALPPVARLPIEALKDLHDRVHDVLIAA